MAAHSRVGTEHADSVAVPRYGENDFFRMGAAVAVGELLDEGSIAPSVDCTPDQVARDYLSSYGVCSREDVDYLGIRGVCRQSLDRLFDTPVAQVGVYC